MYCPLSELKGMYSNSLNLNFTEICNVTVCENQNNPPTPNSHSDKTALFVSLSIICFIVGIALGAFGFYLFSIKRAQQVNSLELVSLLKDNQKKTTTEF
jgi:hypothetical protein